MELWHKEAKLIAYALREFRHCNLHDAFFKKAASTPKRLLAFTFLSPTLTQCVIVAS
jgi:hypothetical protein